MPSAIDRRLHVVLIVEQKLNDKWKMRGSKSLSFPLPEGQPVTVEQLENLRSQVAAAFRSGPLDAMGGLQRQKDVKKTGNILDAAPAAE